MKNLKQITFSIILLSTCSKQIVHKNDLPTKDVVVFDKKKPSSYYVDSTCDLEPEQTNLKKIVDLGLVHREIGKDGRSPSSVKSLYKMAGSKYCTDLTKDELDSIDNILNRMGGRDLYDPSDYDNSAQGLQNYIDDTGVIEKFSASEMISPNHPSVARSCGYDVLLPPQCRWPAGAVQGLVAGKLREFINDGDAFGPKKISLRNWYRPKCYNSNKIVGGAKSSDHIQARGFDLDFESAHDRAKAQQYLCKLYQEDNFNLQVGIGCRTLHIGIGSPKRIKSFGPDVSRFWTYKSLSSCEIKRLKSDNCWKVHSNGNKRIFTSDQSYSGAL